jgi:hypothetical protein
MTALLLARNLLFTLFSRPKSLRCILFVLVIVIGSFSLLIERLIGNAHRGRTMSEQPQQELPEMPLSHSALGVLATVATACVAFGLAAGLTMLMYHFLGAWVNRQMWQLQVGLVCVFGVVILILFSAAWTATADVWAYFTQSRSSDTADRKHGRFSKWAPSRYATPPTEGAHGRCPRCEFCHKWDGISCSHCGYGYAQPE